MKRIFFLLIIIFIATAYGCKKDRHSFGGKFNLLGPIGTQINVNNIKVDKNSACMNEDVMVSVDADSGYNTDANLMYKIGDQFSNPAILKFSNPGIQKIPIIVKNVNQNEITYKEVEVEIKECEETSSLSISAIPTTSNKEIYLFSINESKDQTGDYTYTWDFGDGTAIKTDEKSIIHDYRSRKQDRYSSTFLVKVTASKVFSSLTGRASITIPNIQYISYLMGSFSIPVKYNRFPLLSGDTYSVDVEMNNIFNKKIEFDQAEITYKTCGATPYTDKKLVQPTEIINDVYLPNNSNTMRVIQLSRLNMPASTCAVFITLMGQWEDNKNITAKIFLDIPPSKPGDIAETHYEPVKNQILMRKLNKAVEILGKDKPITPEDIVRLEKMGKL